jgi:hypothetical protein
VAVAAVAEIVMVASLGFGCSCKNSIGGFFRLCIGTMASTVRTEHCLGDRTLEQNNCLGDRTTVQGDCTYSYSLLSFRLHYSAVPRGNEQSTLYVRMHQTFQSNPVDYFSAPYSSPSLQQNISGCK